MQLDFQYTSNSQKQTDRLKPCNRGKSLIKVHSFHLRISLSNQPSFVADHIPRFINLVFKDPFCSNNIYMCRSREQIPYLVSRKLIQLFCACTILEFIFQSNPNCLRLNHGHKTRILQHLMEINLDTSCCSCIQIANHIINFVIPRHNQLLGGRGHHRYLRFHRFLLIIRLLVLCFPSYWCHRCFN